MAHSNAKIGKRIVNTGIPRRKARLMNCLRTILDLEAELRNVREAGMLLGELTSLRSIMHEMDLQQVPLKEDDIQRIEKATSAFLRELRIHFLHHNGGTPAREHLQ